MTSGRPIVASDLPSIREVIDELSSYLVAPDSPRALADGIIRALEHPQEAQEKATRARTLVASYSWQKRAERILKFIS